MTTLTDKDLFRQALAVLELHDSDSLEAQVAIALRARLAQPEAAMGNPISPMEPVAWQMYVRRGRRAPVLYGTYGSREPIDRMKADCAGTGIEVSDVPLYATPPAQPAIDGFGGNLDSAFDAPAPAPMVPDGWVSVVDRLPKPGQVVLASMLTPRMLRRTIRAHHSPLHTVDASNWEDETAVDATEDGNAWEPEGWYEDPVIGEMLEFIGVSDGDVTHWMPLPAAPGSAPALHPCTSKPVDGQNAGNLTDKPAPAVREPLTDEQVIDIAREADAVIYTNRHFKETPAASFSYPALQAFVRAIEAHHGIGIAQGEQT